MDSYVVIYSLFIFIFLWAVVLTFLYVNAVKHYKSLKISSGETLEKTINMIFKGLEQLHSEITSNTERISSIEKNNIKHIQKVTLKRFNPFGDTGGDQSFSIAFLDANNDGVVFSSLHGRSGTRIYAKPVNSGKQKEYELSHEEQEVINLAIKNK